jgi:hypothetical protein
LVSSSWRTWKQLFDILNSTRYVQIVELPRPWIVEVFWFPINWYNMSFTIEDFDVDHLVKSMEHDDSNARTQSFLISFQENTLYFLCAKREIKTNLFCGKKTGFVYSELVVWFHELTTSWQ